VDGHGRDSQKTSLAALFAMAAQAATSICRYSSARTYSIKKLLQLKHKAPGLTVIACIGLLQSSIAPLYELLNRTSDFFKALGDEKNVWAILRLPVLSLLLWFVCFLLVRAAQNKNMNIEFFERFTVCKGLAVLLVWPSILFWYQLFTDFHEALDSLHPFSSLAFSHLLAAFLFAVLVVPLVIYLATRRKAKKTDIKALENLKHNGVPALLWMRPFFQDLGSSRFGKIMGGFVGGSHLIFFYMMLCSLMTPAVLAVKTMGRTIEAYDVNYILARKFGTQTGHYCILDVNANNEALEFAINRCPACARQPGANVLVTHHPIDYRNRHISSVICQ